MKRLGYRILALILIPCLAADPLILSAFQSTHTIHPTSHNLFQEQALATHILNGSHHLLLKIPYVSRLLKRYHPSAVTPNYFEVWQNAWNERQYASPPPHPTLAYDPDLIERKSIGPFVLLKLPPFPKSERTAQQEIDKTHPTVLMEDPFGEDLFITTTQWPKTHMESRLWAKSSRQRLLLTREHVVSQLKWARQGAIPEYYSEVENKQDRLHSHLFPSEGVPIAEFAKRFEALDKHGPLEIGLLKDYPVSHMAMASSDLPVLAKATFALAEFLMSYSMPYRYSVMSGPQAGQIIVSFTLLHDFNDPDVPFQLDGVGFLMPREGTWEGIWSGKRAEWQLREGLRHILLDESYVRHLRKAFFDRWRNSSKETDVLAHRIEVFEKQTSIGSLLEKASRRSPYISRLRRRFLATVDRYSDAFNYPETWENPWKKWLQAGNRSFMDEFLVDEELGDGLPIQMVVKAAQPGEAALRRKWLAGYGKGGFRMHRPREPKIGFAGTGVIGKPLNEINPSVTWRKPFHDPKGIAVNGSRTIIAGSETLYVLDSTTGQMIREIHDARFKDLHTVQFSPFDPNRVLVASTGMDLVLECNVSTGKVGLVWDPWKHGLNRAPDGRLLTDADREGVHDPLGLPFNKLSHLNTAAYDPQDPEVIYVVRFGPGEIRAVDRFTGQHYVLLGGLQKPHGFVRTSDGWVVTDTFAGRVHILKENFRLEETIDFRHLPYPHDVAAGSEWLQFTHEVAPGLYATIDANRNGVWLYERAERRRRFLPLNPDWMVQELVLDRSSPLAKWDQAVLPEKDTEDISITAEVVQLEGLSFSRLRVPNPNTINVLVLEPIKPKLFADFQRQHPIANFDVIRTESELIEDETGKLGPGIRGKIHALVRGHHYQFVIGYLNEVFDADFFRAAKLRGLILMSTGLHNVDPESAAAEGTVITHAPGPTTVPVTEQLIALTLDSLYGGGVSDQPVPGEHRLSDWALNPKVASAVAHVMWYTLMRKALKLDELFAFGVSSNYLRLGVGRNATVYHKKLGQHRSDRSLTSIGITGLDEVGRQLAELAIAHEVPILYLDKAEAHRAQLRRLAKMAERVKHTSSTPQRILEIQTVDLERLLQDSTYVFRTPSGLDRSRYESLAEMDVDAHEIYVRDPAALSQSLRDAVIGLFGFGRIGEAAAQRLLAFGAHVQVHQRGHDRPQYQEKQRRFSEFVGGFEYVSKEALIEASNILALSAALTPETKGWINQTSLERFGRRAPGFIRSLVSITQNLINETDLAAYLHQRPDVQARLDVTSDEHLGNIAKRFAGPDGQLLPNIKLTGHTAAAVMDLRFEKVQIALYKNLLPLIRGEAPSNPVIPPSAKIVLAVLGVGLAWLLPHPEIYASALFFPAFLSGKKMRALHAAA